MRTTFCRSEAQRLRDDCAIHAPPVAVEDIARALLLQVRRIRPWRWRSRSLLRRDLGEIRVNADESPRGQRFSIGHEIGHFLLHPDTAVFSEHADVEASDYAADPEKALEDEADYFSSVLLVPPRWLRADVLAGLSVDALIERYDVSDQVVFIALSQHRLLTKLGSTPRR